jgi:hypothetical protein
MALNMSLNSILFLSISIVILSSLVVTISAVNDTDITIVVEAEDLLSDDQNEVSNQAMNIRFALSSFSSNHFLIFISLFAY